MGQIYWLASYPKSGNTWLRVFLNNYWCNSDRPAQINHLIGGPMASARSVFDEFTGVEASDLTPEEIDCYRPRVYEHLSNNCQEPLFMKVHDAFTRNTQNQPIFAKAAMAGVIYIIRNPLDVVVSYAHHGNQSPATIIEVLCERDYAILEEPQKLHIQFRQRLLSWSRHVESWVDEPDLNILVIRYEDMTLEPVATFTKVVDFVGLEVDANRIAKAIDFSRFDQLQAQETEFGFREKMPVAKSFFRKGKIGSWREVLTESQASQVVAAHGAVMQRFGYLTESGDLIY